MRRSPHLAHSRGRVDAPASHVPTTAYGDFGGFEVGTGRAAVAHPKGARRQAFRDHLPLHQGPSPTHRLLPPPQE